MLRRRPTLVGLDAAVSAMSYMPDSLDALLVDVMEQVAGMPPARPPRTNEPDRRERAEAFWKHRRATWKPPPPARVDR